MGFNSDFKGLIFITLLVSYLWLGGSLSSRLWGETKKLLAVKWVRIFRRVFEQSKHLASIVKFYVLGKSVNL